MGTLKINFFYKGTGKRYGVEEEFVYNIGP